MLKSSLKRLLLRFDLSKSFDAFNPPSITFASWEKHTLSDHAVALHFSFADSPDRACFPSLGTETGCRDLLHDLASLDSFCPEATWLAQDGKNAVGTIQAIINRDAGCGEIQNLGVIPSHRGQGIAARLISLALAELRLRDCHFVRLEVSASNEPALKLYRKFGFESYKTVYAPIRSAMTETGSGI